METEENAIPWRKEYGSHFVKIGGKTSNG